MKIISNVFNEEEILTIKNSIEKKITSNANDKIPNKDINQVFHHKKLGRKIIFGLEIPEKITNKIKKILEQEGFIGYTYQDDTSYLEYSKEYGIPKLIHHVDKDEKETTLVIDYQLDANTDWPIVVINDSFTLKNNELIFFHGKVLPHHRPFKNFLDGEYVKNIIFKFEKEI